MCVAIFQYNILAQIVECKEQNKILQNIGKDMKETQTYKTTQKWEEKKDQTNTDINHRKKCFKI